MISNLKDGLLVEPGDEVAMANAIRNLLEHPDLATRISLTARRTAEVHDWSNVIPEWNNLFSEVLIRINGKN